MRNGRIQWTVDVAPATIARASLPETPSDALWRFARDVDAAYVSAVDSTRQPNSKESERFIFYRGLGEARLPLDVSADAASAKATASQARTVRLTCDPDLVEGLRDVYVVRVAHNKGAYRYLPSLKCGDRIGQIVPAMDDAQSVDRFATSIADDPRESTRDARALRKGSARHGQHVAKQLLHERRHPRALRAAAIVDRSLHSDDDRPAARRAGQSDGRTHRAVDAGA
jgi:hypothetical protein